MDATPEPWDFYIYGVVDAPRPHSLIRSWWSADTHPHRGAVFDATGSRTGWAGVDLYAVRSEQAARARELLLEGLLLEITRWVAAISDKGSAWQASDHELIMFLDANGVHRAES